MVIHFLQLNHRAAHSSDCRKQTILYYTILPFTGINERALERTLKSRDGLATNKTPHENKYPRNSVRIKPRKFIPRKLIRVQ